MQHTKFGLTNLKIEGEKNNSFYSVDLYLLFEMVYDTCSSRVDRAIDTANYSCVQICVH